MKELKLEILATNAIKEYAKIAIAHLLPQLNPFINKKVFLSDGSKAKGFNPTFATIKTFEGMHVTAQSYLKSHYGRLELRIKLCFNGGSHEERTAFCKYVDMDYTIGESKDGQKIDSLYNLNAIIDNNKLNEVIDLNAELQKIAEYKELEEKANEAKRKIKVDANFYKYL